MSRSQQNSSTISNIYTSRNIILELVKERGYNISDYEDRSISDIEKMYTEKQLDMLLTKYDPEDDSKLFIKYHVYGGKIRINQIYEYIDDIYNIEEILSKKDDFIIITKDDSNDTLKKLMDSIWNKENIYFSIYNLNNYLFNILKHEMVPKHNVLTDDEALAIKKKYNILYDNQLPEISRFDKVAEAIGLRPKQVCEILRKSPTSIVASYYRLCS